MGQRSGSSSKQIVLHLKIPTVLYLIEIYRNNIADKSQRKYLKYILGVNKHTSNLAVLSETGRFPMCFSITLSIAKYLHRLENTSNLLLKETYCLSISLHYNGIQTCLMKSFKTFWYKQRGGKCNDGKLDTYFTIKQEFNAEPYLRLEKFPLRKAICKLRRSAHSLMIEAGRYTKPRNLPGSERICKH